MMSKARRLPDPTEVTDGTYLPLPLAAQVAEAHGVAISLTVKSLRGEAAKGKLTVYLVFGRQHTTLGDIRRMFEAGRIEAKPPEPVRKATQRVQRDDLGGAAKAAALMSVERLKEHCREQRRSWKGNR